MVGYFIVGFIIFLFILGNSCLLIDSWVNKKQDKSKDITTPPKIQPRQYYQYSEDLIIYDDGDD